MVETGVAVGVGTTVGAGVCSPIVTTASSDVTLFPALSVMTTRIFQPSHALLTTLTNVGFVPPEKLLQDVL